MVLADHRKVRRVQAAGYAFDRNGQPSIAFRNYRAETTAQAPSGDRRAERPSPWAFSGVVDRHLAHSKPMPEPRCNLGRTLTPQPIPWRETGLFPRP